MSKRTVLLVEDNPDDAFFVERAFRKAGMVEVLRTVSHGEEAVEYLTGMGRFRDASLYPVPSLMLLDLRLPRMSGFEVLEWLRSQPRLNRLPVVILSSSSQSTDIDRAYELGANSYLVKPVSFENLVDMVRALGLYWFVWSQTPHLNI